MATASERIAAALKKKHGGIITTMAGGNVGLVRGVISTGIAAVDNHLLGIGGLAWERITEVFGAESSGKSSFVMACIAAAQRANAAAVYVDAENACTQERAEVFGIDRSSLIMASDLDSAEQGLGIILDAVLAHPKDKDAPPMLGVYDSVPAAVTIAERESDLGDAHMAPLSRLMSKMIPRLVQALRGRNAHVLFVNQVREKPGVMFGSPEYTPGGKALKFYASARLRFRGVKVRDGGLEVEVKSVKNKLAEPRRELTSFLNFKKGWDDTWTTLNFAKDAGAVEKRSRDADGALEALGWDIPAVPVSPMAKVAGALREKAAQEEAGKDAAPAGKKTSRRK